jgi:tetratricopeptide (TPR) repeat protein
MAVPGMVAAATPAEIFSRANDAYEAEKFEEAAAGYARILNYGMLDPRVYYNLGNSYFKMGRLGAAILNYERARKLDPSDPETRDNLELARGQIRDRVAETEVQYPIRALKRLLDAITVNAMTLVFLAFYLTAGGLLGIIVLARAAQSRRALGYGALAAGLCAALLAGALAYKVHDAATPLAIVMQDKADVRSGPAEDNTVLFTVHEGTILEVHNHLEGWYQVSLPNALSGWIPEIAVEKV